MKHLVLVGAGHAHALVLRGFARRRLSGVRLTLVSPEPYAPYSGMVPGWLAGCYRFEEIAVDCPALATAAGATWLQGEVASLAPADRVLTLADGRVLAYDLLSLNVGATLRPPSALRARMLPLRPLARLRAHYETLLDDARRDPATLPHRVTAVGGGAAGFEALLGVLSRLRRLYPDHPVQGRLVTRSDELLPELPDAARRAARRALERAGVALCCRSVWSTDDDRPGETVLWATGAEAHDWQHSTLGRGDLATDAQGYIQIDDTLRSLSHPEIYATGDCASWQGRSLPKAGVHAVRMGPVLLHNLVAASMGTVSAAEFRSHRPPKRFLALLATGDRRAIATRGGFTAEGGWAWQWKDWIDRRFMSSLRGAS